MPTLETIISTADVATTYNETGVCGFLMAPVGVAVRRANWPGK